MNVRTLCHVRKQPIMEDILPEKVHVAFCLAYSFSREWNMLKPRSLKSATEKDLHKILRCFDHKIQLWLHWKCIITSSEALTTLMLKRGHYGWRFQQSTVVITGQVTRHIDSILNYGVKSVIKINLFLRNHSNALSAYYCLLHI